MNVALISIFLMFYSSVFAHSVFPVLTCPSIEEVKNQKNIWPKGGWMPLYINNEELASLKDIDRFRETAIEFRRAEWSEDYQEAGHCFYVGVQDMVLARDMLAPDAEKFQDWVYKNKKTAWCELSDPVRCVYGIWSG